MKKRNIVTHSLVLLILKYFVFVKYGSKGKQIPKV